MILTQHGMSSISRNTELPAYTLELLFTDGITPTFSKGTAKQVSTSPNVWRLTYKNGVWYELLQNQTDLIEVLQANTAGVRNMSDIFNGCTNLTSVALFDTSNATDMSYMFRGCSSLTSIPRFDTSKVTNMNYAFAVCNNVQSGALSLYQQASTQETPPSSHTGTFLNCGTNTTTGSSELAQIPTDWK